MIKKYFLGSTLSTLIGLPLCAWISWYYNPTIESIIQGLFIGTVLAVLEVSLSFDNAVVNASVLQQMTPKWQHRFLTWGMLIAVFGMRLVFPLAIVSVIAWINPVQALVLAATSPEEYARIMMSAHHLVSAFGGTFLMMVALKFFYDENKDHHWIPWIEVPARFAGRIDAIEMTLTMIFLLILSRWLSPELQFSYLIAGMAGLIVFQIVESIGTVLEHFGAPQVGAGAVAKSSAALFIYLEVLDASFSFDGVVGAFAITNNLFIIMIGLSIGAFFVRSLTILFVDKNTLQHFTYLEHGAFYAIGILASLMLLSPFFHIPEWITGLSGALILVAAVFHSLKVPHAVRD